MKDGLYYGWLPGLMLGEFLDRHAGVVAHLPFIMLTSIDSETAVSRMPWVRRNLANDPSWAVTTDPLVISGQRLLTAANKDKIFTGFDEIWVPRGLPAPPPPSDVALVVPAMFDVALPDHVRNWLRHSGYRLGLGDGDGMNYVGTDPILASQLDLPVNHLTGP